MAKRARKTGRRAPKQAPPKRRPRLVWRLAKWAAVAAIWGLVAVLGVVAFYAYDLPDVGNLGERQRTPSVTLLAADGARIARYGDVYGEPAPVEALPPALIHAVLATEDRRFYNHLGLDPIALVRAALANLEAGRIVQGGSTLTQQLAKNLFLTPERTFKRKLQELILALWLEHRFTKDEILAIYLNRVYLGAGTYGVAAASRRYFGKPPGALGLVESAMIAGLLKAPSRYAPTSDLDRARGRARQVLRNMVEAGYLTEAEFRAAADRPLTVADEPRAGVAARYFADWVRDRIAGYAGPGASDIVVETTLDPRLQRAAEDAVDRALAGEGAERGVGQAALVALDPGGAVRALVGGRDYGASQFNRATQAERQPGSAFKPVVYLAALEAGIGPETVVEDAPLEIDGWRPQNYDDRYAGPVTVREAVARSLNTVAVRVALDVGLDRVVRMARRLGITAELRRDASLALGASEVTLLELTAAYAVLANRGHGVWPHAIRAIRTVGGEVLFRRAGSGPGRVVAERDARTMTAMLAAVIEDGTGRAARIPWPAAGKTGTSQDWRDAWFVAYTRDLVAGVWVGNDDGAPMERVTGGGLPARLWARFMARALAGTAPQPLARPEPPPPQAATAAGDAR